MSSSATTDLLQEALALHRRGSLDEAIAGYREVLRLEPANADANYHLGMISCQRGRFAEGAEFARKSLASDAGQARAHVLLGRAVNALGRSDDALVSFDRAVALAPDLAQTHSHRADFLSDLGRHAEAIAGYDLALALAPDCVEDWFNRGVALGAVGRHDDAISSLDRAIAGKPDFIQAHVQRATALLAMWRHNDALESADRALAIAPAAAEAWLARGNALIPLKRFDEAFAAFDRALALKPNLAAAWLGRGNTYSALARYHDALAAYERALSLKPDFAEALLGRGGARAATGRPDLAIDDACRALELGETDEAKTSFTQSVMLANVMKNDEKLRQLLSRAITEGWTRPNELAGACLGLIKQDARIDDCMARINAAWPARLASETLMGSSAMAALANDQLLNRVLQCLAVTDIGIERLLTNVRFLMLRNAANGTADEDLLGFYCSVAAQCFINEYVFSTTEAEAEEARRLRASLEEALTAGDACPALWVAVVAAYFPLHALANAETLLGRSWPKCIEALIVQQIREPAEERRIATMMPSLTEIGDGASRAVRQQYEESPYPRWVVAGPPRRPAILGDRRPDYALDVLIAGCGTGRFALDFARDLPNSRFLALDLSVASLSYAKRMADQYDLANIEFAQADIMRLASIDRQFDFIDVSGVLHHLADPWAGWRVLQSLLRPGGLMQVGLYSKLARLPVVAGRALISARGYRPVPEGIRRCREEIIGSNDPVLRSLIWWPDFFTTSDCRDLLFHVEEHRTTLPEIKSFLSANDLEFVGFYLPMPFWRRFASRFPDRSAANDLDCWHTFETEAPDTFEGMYQFCVRKPRAST